MPVKCLLEQLQILFRLSLQDLRIQPEQTCRNIHASLSLHEWISIKFILGLFKSSMDWAYVHNDDMNL